jgi:hypothetical protein
MGKEIKDNDQDNSFEYRLKEVSDEEIISILRYREHFNPQAVKAAVKEALKRGLIESVDDLNKPDFSPLPIPPRSIFPIGANRTYTFAIFKSLCRIYYGFALIPFIYGIFSIVGGTVFIGLAAIIAAIGVMFVINRLEKKVELFWANTLVFVNLPAIAWGTFYLSFKSNLAIMDIFSVAVVVIVLLYSSIYLRKLTNFLNGETDD